MFSCIFYIDKNVKSYTYGYYSCGLIFGSVQLFQEIIKIEHNM